MRLYLAMTDGKDESALVSRCAGFLPTQKAGRIDRLQNGELRKEMLLGEVLLRRGLRDMLGHDVMDAGAVPKPFQVERRLGPFGKPSIAIDGRPGPAFSISHSHGAVLVAVDRWEVGVDIERIRPLGDRVARRILTDAEFEAWVAAGRPDDLPIGCWTRRESELKYLGLGISGLEPAMTDDRGMPASMPQDVSTAEVEVPGDFRATVCGRLDGELTLEKVGDL